MRHTHAEHTGVGHLGSATFEDRMAPDTEARGLLEAWMEERGRSVEYLLLLDRVQRLLTRFTTDETLTKNNRLKAKTILRAIEVVRQEGIPDGV